MHCVNRIDILGLIGDPGPDPANSLVNCKFNLALELVPKNEFSKWNLAKLGSTFVSNSEEMLQAAGKLVPKYDPNGGCCKGGCISHLTITHHGPGSGNVAMSTDETEKFSLSEEYDINYTLENGKPLNNTQISNLLRNEAALATLSQLKKYLCRKSKVSIAQCGSEYGAGFNKYGTLKGRLEAFFGPNVTIETFDGLCGVRFGKPTTWWLDEGE